MRQNYTLIQLENVWDEDVMSNYGGGGDDGKTG